MATQSGSAQSAPTRRTEYLAYLQSDHWKQLRAWLGVRCSGRCEACNHDGSVWLFDGHHLVYRTPLESGVLADLLGLCRRCHDIVHDLKIPDLFARGTPVEIIRDRTLHEIRRYLPDLYPRPTGPHRIYLRQEPRRVGTLRPRGYAFFSKRAKKSFEKRAQRSDKGELAAANDALAARQAHLPRHHD